MPLDNRLTFIFFQMQSMQAQMAMGMQQGGAAAGGYGGGYGGYGGYGIFLTASFWFLLRILT